MLPTQTRLFSGTMDNKADVVSVLMLLSSVDRHGEAKEPLQGHCDDELFLLRNILRIQYLSGSPLMGALMSIVPANICVGNTRLREFDMLVYSVFDLFSLRSQNRCSPESQVTVLLRDYD